MVSNREPVPPAKVSLSTWGQVALLLLVALAIALPRLFALDRFVATDEVAWLVRSGNFYYALGQRDFAATDLNRSPGVVTMWVETVAFLLDFPTYRGLGQGMLNKYSLFESLLLSNGIHPHTLLVTGRLLMVLLNTALLVVAFTFARRLVGVLPALVGFLLIAFDPYHLAITRLAHLDGPLSSFLFLSLLAFLSYLYRGRRLLDLLISGVAGGLALLAKIPALILLPVLGLLASLAYLAGRKPKPGSSTPARSLLRGLIAPLAIWGGVFLFAIVIFFPAMWVQPLGSLSKMVFSSFGFASQVSQEREMPPTVIAEEESGDAEIWSGIAARPAAYFLRYPVKYLWRATPVSLLGLLVGLAALALSYGVFKGEGARRGGLGLLLFVAFFTVIMTVPPKSSSKYYIPVYPALDLIAGVGWVVCADGLAQKIRGAPWKRVIPLALLGTVILIQALQALQTYPYYFTYFNPLLGGSRNASEELSMGSGEGLDQAAAYLNAKPDARKLKVMAWYGTGPFSYYFVGKTIALTPSSNMWDADAIAELKGMDYLVIYSNQWRRQIPGGLFPWLEGLQPEHSIWIDGIEYARIYAVKSFPPEKFASP
jgi:hypothetical protein